MTILSNDTVSLHYPVLQEELVKVCDPKPGGKYLDCTFGGGGHSKAILNFPLTNVIAFDRDHEAIKRAEKYTSIYKNRFTIKHCRFSEIENNVGQDFKPDVIIFDLGLSSYQIKNHDRGFSFLSSKNLDMNMGLSNINADKVINKFSEINLKSIIKFFGDEKEAAFIAKGIVKSRSNKPIETTDEFVQIIKNSKKKFSKKINPCTKTFQALRIFINKEVSELIFGLISATKILKDGGKIIVITFHSLEDKIVKFFFKNFSENKSRSSRYFPEDNSKQNFFYNYNNVFLNPSDLEVKNNPASRSAKLRYVTRNQNPFFHPKEFFDKFKNYLIILLFLFSLNYVRGTTDQEFIIFLWITISIFLSDIGGYIFGKIFKGKRLTKISPNKTGGGNLGDKGL